MAHRFPRGLLLADSSKVLQKARGRGLGRARSVPMHVEVPPSGSSSLRLEEGSQLSCLHSRQTRQDRASRMPRARGVV